MKAVITVRPGSPLADLGLSDIERRFRVSIPVRSVIMAWDQTVKFEAFGEPEDIERLRVLAEQGSKRTQGTQVSRGGGP